MLRLLDATEMARLREARSYDPPIGHTSWQGGGSMLVLSRRSGERIWIDGGRIEVKVLRVDGQRVRLGFVAPDDVSIQRDEVFRQTQLFAEVGASDDSGSINWSHTFDRS